MRIWLEPVYIIIIIMTMQEVQKVGCSYRFVGFSSVPPFLNSVNHLPRV